MRVLRKLKMLIHPNQIPVSSNTFQKILLSILIETRMIKESFTGIMGTNHTSVFCNFSSNLKKKMREVENGSTSTAYTRSMILYFLPKF